MRRRLIELGLAMAAGAAGAGLVGARPAAKTIEARALYLVDDDDRVRAIFGIDGDEVVLSLRDAEGRPRIMAGVRRGGPVVTIRGEGESSVGLGVHGTRPLVEATNRDGRAVFSAP